MMPPNKSMTETRRFLLIISPPRLVNVVFKHSFGFQRHLYLLYNLLAYLSNCRFHPLLREKKMRLS